MTEIITTFFIDFRLYYFTDTEDVYVEQKALQYRHSIVLSVIETNQCQHTINSDTLSCTVQKNHFSALNCYEFFKAKVGAQKVKYNIQWRIHRLGVGACHAEKKKLTKKVKVFQ